LVEGFILTLDFEDDLPCIYSTLYVVRENIFANSTSLTWKQPDWIAQLDHALECYNSIVEENEYSCNIDITKSEGHRKVIGPEP